MTAGTQVAANAHYHSHDRSMTGEIVSRGCNFLCRAVFRVYGKGYLDDHMTTNHRHMSLSRLSRRPVLVAMMMYLAAFGAAIIALWSEASGVSTHQQCENLLKGPAEGVGGSEASEVQTHAAHRYFLI